MVVSEISDIDISNYVNANTDAVFATRKRRLAVIQSFMQFCMAKGIVEWNMVADVRVRRDVLKHSQLLPKERAPVTDDEILRLLEWSTGFHNLAIRIGRATGLRLGDICKLQWDSIVGAKLTVVTSKSGAVVRHDLSPDIILGLNEFKGLSDVYCFPEEARRAMDPVKRCAISMVFRRIFTAAGIPDKSFHCLRHTYAVETKKAAKVSMLQQLIDEIGTEKTRDLMGHANVATTRGYSDHS